MKKRNLSLLLVPLLGLGLAACEVDTVEDGEPARAEATINEEDEQAAGGPSFEARIESREEERASADSPDLEINRQETTVQTPDSSSSVASGSQGESAEADVEVNRQETTVGGTGDQQQPQQQAQAESETQQQN